MVDDGVEEGMREVVAPGFSDIAAATADAAAHGLEDVALVFLLDGDEELLADEHAHLLTLDVPLGIEVEHFRDDEEVAVILLHLGPLAGVEDVFQRKGVEIETFANLFQDLDVPEAIDINPRDAIIVEAGEELFHVLDLPFDQVVLIVFDEGDLGGDGGPLADARREGRRSLAGDWAMGFEHGGPQFTPGRHACQRRARGPAWLGEEGSQDVTCWGHGSEQLAGETFIHSEWPRGYGKMKTVDLRRGP